MSDKAKLARRAFIRRCAAGAAALAWGGYAARSLLLRGADGGLRIGWRNDAPGSLTPWSREASWYDRAAGGTAAAVQCRLCPHECILGENDRGFCRTRVVKGGKLYSLVYGNPCAVHVDPIEKKPLYHFHPGSAVLSLATAGCNLRCLNCQNWEISQARPEETDNIDLPPERLAAECRAAGIPAIAYTYSEPGVFYEYVYDSAHKGRAQGLKNVLVTAGYINEPPLRQLAEVIDAANVDVKSFSPAVYRKLCGASLAPVLGAVELLRREGVWVEITRLMVPEYSDRLEDIKEMARWMVQTLGPDVPLHISRFHPAYRLSALPSTPLETLRRAWETAREAGLYHVYIGNAPESGSEDTSCPGCGRLLIERRGMGILLNRLAAGGRCSCGREISGVWS